MTNITKWNNCIPYHVGGIVKNLKPVLVKNKGNKKGFVWVFRTVHYKVAGELL